jgi:tetratricopeptide (TPR) repeat protein
VEAAREAAGILARLQSESPRALDRAAQLHYRQGELDQALDLLEQWHRLRPEDPLPLARQAVLLHEQGRGDASEECLRRALGLCGGRRRANVAFLGARQARHRSLAGDEPAARDAAPRFLEDCVGHDPRHADALWCLAAVRWLQGDTAALAAQAAAMDQPDVADPRFQFLAALSHLAGNDFAAVLSAAARVAPAGHAGRNGDAASPDLAAESQYLAALARVGVGDRPAAIDALAAVARAPGPSAAHAQALLGAVQFAEGRHEEAVRTWHALDARARQTWGLAEPLAYTTFVTALEDLLRGNYEQSAEKFRQAGRLGCRDRRLGPLLLLALFKAGQQAIYVGETAGVQVS